MKKPLLYLLIIIVLISSCSSTYSLIIDEASPNATVIFKNDKSNGVFLLKKWNDAGIIERLYGRNSLTFVNTSKETFLTVPTGINKMTFNAIFYLKNRGDYEEYYLEDIEFQHNFEPGKKYEIKSKVVYYSVMGLLDTLGGEYPKVHLFIAVDDTSISYNKNLEWVEVGEARR